MRIDLSPKGMVVGTRRVSDTGLVSGLDEHAGKDVLILVPNGRPVLKNTLMDYMHEWEKIAERNAKWAAKELRAWQEKLPRSPEAALELAKAQLDWEKLAERLPPETRKNVAKQIKDAQKRVKVARSWIEARLPVAAKPAKRSRRAASKTPKAGKTA